MPAENIKNYTPSVLLEQKSQPSISAKAFFWAHGSTPEAAI
jgi:hypothetical protein